MTGSDDGFVYIWDRHSEGIVQWLCADLNGSVNVIEPHPSLPMFATSGIDYDFKVSIQILVVHYVDGQICSAYHVFLAAMLFFVFVSLLA